MQNAERVVHALRARGDLLESGAGVTGFRGDTLHLFRALEAVITQTAGCTDSEPCEEWAPPPVVALSTLARASYFASFPQWLTLAAHLREDMLETVADSGDPVTAARAACAPAEAALPPAACYHVYAGLADRELDAPFVVTLQCTCWRHEGARLRPLARAWAFTMREGVCLGTAATTHAFRARGADRGIALAKSLGLSATLEQATDPFFASTARGRKLLQQVKGLKQELLLDLGDERVAAASFNLHDDFFGRAFAIAIDGAPAHSACVAYGIDRWMLAFLVAHGPDARNWPSLAPQPQLLSST
ncbi:MAG: hypothetical protein V4550_10955 [Gemmatimonadota bacterium]